MKSMFRSILICSVFLSAVLFWFKPADNLILLKSIDWEQQYKDKVLTPKKSFGAMGFAKELIRKENMKLTFDEYVVKEIDGQLIKVNSLEWQNWIKDRLSNKFIAIYDPIYFTSDNPLMKDVNLPLGYLEIQNKNGSNYFWFNKLGPDELNDKSIPKDLKYQKRFISMILLVGLIIVLLFNKLISKTDDLLAQSFPGKGMNFFMWIFMCGIALSYLPFFYGWFQDSPPFVFLGGFITISGVIGLVMFGYQYVFTYKLLSGKKELLAHWVFNSDEWNNFTEKEYKAEKSEKKGLLLFISCIILFVGVVFWLIMRDKAAGIVFLVLLGVIAILTIVAVLIPWLTYRRNKNRQGEIFLSKDGLYLNGAVHTWRFAGSRFEGAEYLSKPFKCLSITYSYWMMAGRVLYFYRNFATVRVPVPVGKEEEAKQIIDKIQINSK